MKKRLLHTVILTTLLSSLLNLASFAQETGMAPAPALKSAPLQTTPGGYENLQSLFGYDPSTLTDYAHIGTTGISQAAIDIATSYQSGQISASDLSAFLSGNDFSGIGYFLSSLSADQMDEILEDYPFLNDTWSGTPLYKVCTQSFSNIDGYNSSVSHANNEIDTFNVQRKTAYGLTGKTALITGYDYASYQDALKPIEVYDAYDKCYRRGALIPNKITIGNDSGGIYWAPSDQLKNEDGSLNMSAPIKNFAISCSAKVMFSYTLYIEDPRCETFQPLVFYACPEEYTLNGQAIWAKYDDMFTDGSYMGTYVKEEGKAAVFSSFFINHAAITLPVFSHDEGCTYIYSIGKDSSAQNTGITPADLSGAGFGGRGVINTLESTHDASASWMRLDNALDNEFYGIYVGNNTTNIPRSVNTSALEGFWPEDTSIYHGRMTGNSIYTSPHYESNRHFMYAAAKDEGKGKMLHIMPDRYNPISYQVLWDFDDEYQERDHDYQVSSNTVITNNASITQKVVTTTETYNNYDYVSRGYKETSARYTGLSAQITSNITFDLGSSKQIDPIVKTINVKAKWVEQNPKDINNPIVLEQGQDFVNLRSLQGEQIHFKRILDLDQVYYLQLPSIDRPGYTFTGWTDDSGKEYTPGKYYYFRYDKDYHMTAHFTPLSYKVRVFGVQQNGQRSSEPDAEYNCVFDGQNPNIEPLEIPNYHFRSWGVKSLGRVQNMYVNAPADLSEEAYYDHTSWSWKPLSIEDPLISHVDTLHQYIINNISIHLITTYHARSAQETILDDTTLPSDYTTQVEPWKIYSRLLSQYTYWNRVEEGYSKIEIDLSVPGSLDHNYTFVNWTASDPNSIVPAYNGQVIDFYPAYTANIPDKFQMIYQTEDGQILQRNEINKQTDGIVASVGPSKTGYKPYYLLDGEEVNVGDSIFMDSDKILTLQYRPITMKMKLVNAAHSEDTDAPVVKSFDLLYDTPMQIRDILEGLDIANTSGGSTSQATYLVGLSTDIYDTDALVSGEELSDEAVPKEEFLVNPKYTGSLKDGMTIEVYPVWDIAATYTVRTFMEKDEYEDANDKYELVNTEVYNARPSTQITVSPSLFEGYVTPSDQTTTITPNGQTKVDFYYDKEKQETEEENHTPTNQPTDMKEALKSAQDFVTDLSSEINLANMALRAQRLLDGETDNSFVSDLTLLKEAFAQGSLEKDVLVQALASLENAKNSGYEKVIALNNYQNSVSSQTTLQDLLNFEKEADTNLKKYQFSYMAIWYAPAFGQTAMANDFMQAADTVLQRGTTDYHELMDLLVSYQEMIDGYEKAVFVTVKHKLVVNGEGVVVKEETFASEAGNTFTPVPITDTIQDQVDGTRESILVLAPDNIPTYTMEKDKNLTIELEYGLKDLTQSTQQDPETYTMRVKYVARKDGQDTLLDTLDTVVEKGTSFTPDDLEGYEEAIKALFGNNIVIKRPDTATYTADQNRIITYPYLVTIPATAYTATINYKVSYKGQIYDLLSQQKSIPAGTSFTPERFTGDEAVIKAQYGENIQISLPQVNTFEHVDGNITINYIYGVSETGTISGNDPADTENVTISISYKVSIKGQETLIGNKEMETEKGKEIQIPGFKDIEQYVQNNYPGKVITYPQNMTLTPSASATVSVVYILSDPEPEGKLTIKHMAVLPDGSKRLIGSAMMTGYTGTVPCLSEADVKNAFKGQDIEVTMPDAVTFDGKEDKEVVYEYGITLSQNPNVSYHITYKAVLDQTESVISETTIAASQFDNTNVPDPANLDQLIKELDERAAISNTDVRITNMEVVVTYTLEVIHKIKIYHVFVSGSDRISIGQFQVEGSDTYQAIPFTKNQLEEKLGQTILSVTIPDAVTIDLTKDQDYTFEYEGTLDGMSVSENTVAIHVSYYASLDGESTYIGKRDLTAIKGQSVQIPDLEGWRDKLIALFGDVLLPNGVDAVITPDKEVSSVDYDVTYTVTKKAQTPDVINVTLHHVAYAEDGSLIPLADTYLFGNKGQTVMANPLSQKDLDQIFQNVEIENLTLPESYSIYLEKDMEKYMYYTVLLKGGQKPVAGGDEQQNPSGSTQNTSSQTPDAADTTSAASATTVTFTQNADGTVSITAIDTTSSSVTIPSSVEKDGKVYQVKEVSDALAGSDVKSVEIEDGITSIAPGAFEDCKKLVSVTIPSTVTKIGDCSFKNTTSLKEVNIANGTAVIGKEAFAGSGIKKASLPSSVKEISDNAFAGSKLASISMPKVTKIGKGAFKKTNLTTVSLKEVKTIGDSAFEGSSLKSVTIGKKTTKIGKNAFKNCKGLKKVVIKSTKITSIGKNAFKGIYKKAKIKVPAKKFAAYKKMLKGKVPKTVKITK